MGTHVDHAVDWRATLEKELEQAAVQGFKFLDMAPVSLSVIMQKDRDGGREGRLQYKLLETRRISTMGKKDSGVGR